MNKKLIAIDLDGTTLNNESEIGKYTEEVFTEVAKKGHLICIVTGRSYRNSQRFYRQLQLNTPMVNFNGALCHHPHDHQWDASYKQTLDKHIALSMLQMNEFEHVKMIAAETIDAVYMDRDFIPYPEFFNSQNENAQPFDEQSLNEDPISVSIFTHNDHAHNLIKDRILSLVDNKVEVRTWGGFAPCLELVQAGVQKAMGVERIAEYYRIPRQDILAFGDEDNDYEMIQYAGHGVAMANAIMPIKKIADDQTPFTNAEQGVARYLAEYFNL
ncbi:Cof-type HAD-IIB family hydrolase [Allofustis seminis]|uniref:Cof-type HAD-IIB family hydrolase n=1 Tax=Allofustis seminis TaxID=166939 RepID=UPI00035EC617|nr:Cof-type HAD-IIB family hydrolase [Allofustis seminis]